jgi:hypothetical protein
MARTTRVFITTDDTGKTYELGIKKSNAPQLWLIRVQMACIDEAGYAHIGWSQQSPKEYYVERSTLEKLGMVPVPRTADPKDPEEEKNELRETLEKLLSLVGIYPAT